MSSGIISTGGASSTPHAPNTRPKRLENLASLLTTQGAFECGFGALFFMTTIMSATRETDDPGGADGERTFYRALATCIVLVVCGLLKLRGARAIRHAEPRSYIHVALLSALPLPAAPWCAPTGLAVMVYGLWLLRRPEVRGALDADDAARRSA